MDESATIDVEVGAFSEQQDFEADTGRHYAELADGLRREIETLWFESPRREELCTDIDAFGRRCLHATRRLSYAEWRRLLEEYRGLVHRKASVANELSRVARIYSSMDEFWSDADAQERGESSHTYWDTYEHGRRRQLETIFANAYGSSAALLVNSGMSGIAVVTGMLNLRTGDNVLTGERCYFETSDYLARFVSQTGVTVRRVSVDEPEAITEALRQTRPALAIFETVTNVPGVPIARNWDKWLAASPKTFFLIDNSVQSHLTCWFEIMTEDPRVLVVESGTKYLSEEAMVGVLYGHAEAIERARDYARATGQQLQEKAFNYISEAEIRAAGRKLGCHSRNVTAFIESLQPFAPLFAFIRTLDASARNEPLAIFRRGRGALIFAQLKTREGDAESLPKLHRWLLVRWRELMLKSGIELHIRAGFGWNQTSARAYESGRLNQADAPCFIRISVGCEPVEAVRTMAFALGQAAHDVTEGQSREQ
jgi:Cys/Met metabolism PLP-dependent enzyme